MKNVCILLVIIFVRHCMFGQCNSGPLIITSNTTINGSCIITGDLTIVNGGTLDVDFTSSAVDTFVVRGNILLQGDAVLRVRANSGAVGEQFIVSNSTNNQRTITTQDSSRIQFENIEFRTQEGDLTNAASFYMNYNASGKSVFYVDHCSLNRQTAWLLCNLYNHSTLIGYEPDGVPTEMYIQDTVQVALHGAATDLGIWLNFDSVLDTLDLPSDQTQPYTWSVGRGQGGLNTTWYLELDTAKAGIGVQIMPSTRLTINGTGQPNTGELKVALMYANGMDTVNHLSVGLQNTIVHDGTNGFVKLNNVNLGPIAWQVYILMNENLLIKNSVINEIGIAGPSQVVVDSSLLQLAVLASVGAGGSSFTINNSEIFNQAIVASNNSTIELNNCSVTGSAFNTTDAQSHITVNGGCFFPNPSGCNGSNMININTGQPYCNPFVQAGMPQNLTPSTVTFNGVNTSCTTSIIQNSDVENEIKIYPNPVEHMINVEFQQSTIDQQIVIYTAAGQLIFKTDKMQVDLTNLSSGIYIMQIKQANQIWYKKIVKR